MTTVNIVYRDLVVDPIVQSIEWSGDITLPHRTLSLTVRNTLNGVDRAIPFELGSELRMNSGDGTELFRGVIFKTRITETGETEITAYDENVYLTKSTDTKRFASMTAAAIVRELCRDFGIATGSIAETGYVIPKLILRDQTLWEIIVTALTETRKQNGRRFFVYADGGRLNLVERKGKVAEWLLEDGANITSAAYSQSIEDMRTQVKVVGGDDKKPVIATLKNDALIAKYGIMQHLENADSDLKASQLEQLARQLLDDLGKITDIASVDALGIADVTAGGAVYVKESMTGVVGAYYVSTDVHTWEGGVHRMSLTLSATDDLPQMEYVEPASETAKKKKKKKDDGMNLTMEQVAKLLS